MAKYVVFKKHGDPHGEPTNEVYYQYHLEDAITFADFKAASTGLEWEVAEVFELDSWLGRLVRWAVVRK